LPNRLPNLPPDRQRRKPPRYLRIERGLFRDSRNGGLWHVAKRAGKVR
jgi:hypothetical protein